MDKPHSVAVGSGIFPTSCWISANQKRKEILCSEGNKDILRDNPAEEAGRATALYPLTEFAVLWGAKPRERSNFSPPEWPEGNNAALCNRVTARAAAGMGTRFFLSYWSRELC